MHVASPCVKEAPRARGSLTRGGTTRATWEWVARPLLRPVYCDANIHSAMRRASRRILLAVLFCALFAIGAWLILMASMDAGRTAVPAFVRPVVDESDIADFLGDHACAECHPRENAEHARTFHKATLRRMTRRELGSLAPPAGPIPDSACAIVDDGGSLVYEVDVPGRPDQYRLWPLHLALDAGKHGITPVHLTDGGNVVEMRRSWFPREGIWRPTVGKSVKDPAKAVDVHELEISRACIGCHSVALSKNAFAPRPEHFGVGCESCHGPGRAHIRAVRARSRDLRMARLAKADPETINILCGRCHGLEKDVRDSPVRRRMTYRFHSYGLMESRCCQASGKRLGCLQCHDPHANASTDAAGYEQACLACHATGSGGSACPVSPRSGCVPCHMPRRDVMHATGEVYGLKLVEHKIAVYPDVTAARAGR